MAVNIKNTSGIYAEGMKLYI